MATVKESLARLEAHEKECALRYENIEKRLDAGSKKFDRLMMMIVGVYPFILAATALAKWMGPMGWLQDYNGSETTWVHVVLLFFILGGLFFLSWFFGVDSTPIVEVPDED